MTLPGLITGQPISGQGVGQAIVNFLPCLPGEGPPGMPRFIARQLFPRGFAPGMIAALPAELPVPTGPADAAVDARGNAISRTQLMPAAIPEPAPQPTQADMDRDIRTRRMMHRRISPH